MWIHEGDWLVLSSLAAILINFFFPSLTAPDKNSFNSSVADQQVGLILWFSLVVLNWIMADENKVVFYCVYKMLPGIYTCQFQIRIIHKKRNESVSGICIFFPLKPSSLDNKIFITSIRVWLLIAFTIYSVKITVFHFILNIFSFT